MGLVLAKCGLGLMFRFCVLYVFEGCKFKAFCTWERIL